MGSSLGNREPTGVEASNHFSHPLSTCSHVIRERGKHTKGLRQSQQSGTWPAVYPRSGVPPAPLLPGPGDMGLKASSLSQSQLAA